MRDDDPVPLRAPTAAILTVRFRLEVGALVGFAVGGAAVGSGVSAVVLAVLPPLAAAGMWGVWAAPKSARGLPPTARSASKSSCSAAVPSPWFSPARRCLVSPSPCWQRSIRHSSTREAWPADPISGQRTGPTSGTRRRRIGPRTLDGSTTAPRCNTSASPFATGRRATARVGSISGRQSVRGTRVGPPPTGRLSCPRRRR
jgi:hypothetical protein